MLLLRTLLNYVLPIHCYLCDEPSEDLICIDCADDFLLASSDRCQTCGIGLSSIDQLQNCGECLRDPPSFDYTIVATDYLAPADQIVQQLKFGHRLVLADLMAHQIRDAVIKHCHGELPQILTPIPLHPKRLIERGFNQAQEIGRTLAPQLGVTFSPELVKRIKETQAQSSLPLKERRANTKNAFVCNLGLLDKIRDQHIGVIDDVMTTGTTLNEVAKTLKRHGARTVTNLVFARTPKQP